jgi:predicted secreted protein
MCICRSSEAVVTGAPADNSFERPMMHGRLARLARARYSKRAARCKRQHVAAQRWRQAMQVQAGEHDERRARGT